MIVFKYFRLETRTAVIREKSWCSNRRAGHMSLCCGRRQETMAGEFQVQVLALRLLKHKVIRRAPATGRSRTQYDSEISRVSPPAKTTMIPSTRTRTAEKRLEVRLDAKKAVQPMSGSRAERGSGQRRCEQESLSHGIPKMLPSLRIRRARTIRHTQMRLHKRSVHRRHVLQQS